MWNPVDDPHSKFGIDEVYFHNGLDSELLHKLRQRASLSLDAEETVVQKHVANDMVLIFHKRVPSKSMIYRFLEFLSEYAEKETYLKDNTLLNEDELLAAIKTKKFVLVTEKTLLNV